MHFQDIEVEDRTHFAIINPRTAAPTVAVSAISCSYRCFAPLDEVILAHHFLNSFHVLPLNLKSLFA